MNDSNLKSNPVDSIKSQLTGGSGGGGEPPHPPDRRDMSKKMHFSIWYFILVFLFLSCPGSTICGSSGRMLPTCLIQPLKPW